MNTLFAPDKSLAEPLQRILVDLHDCTRSHIVLVTADDAILRHETAAELARQLSGQYVLYEFDYTQTDQLSLPRFCRTLPRDRPVCVFATHLEQLKHQDQDKYETALHFLNAHREDLRLTRTTVVLWLTLQTYKDLWESAPDFADWRTTDVTFSLPEGRRVEETQLGKLSLKEAEELRHQIRRFEDILARDGLEPAMRAELEKQRALAFKQLGQEEDSKAAVTASSQAAAELGDYQRFADLYRQHVIDRFGKLTLYSLSSDAPLSVDLEQVFVKLTAIQKQQRTREARGVWRTADPKWGKLGEGSPSQLPEDKELNELDTFRQEDLSVTLSIGETLAAHHNLAIIGAPGSGKTTLLRYLALTFARQHAGERLSLDEDRLPLLITLRDFNRFLDNLKQNGNLLDLGPQLLPQFLNEHVQNIARHLNLPHDFFSRQLDAHDCIMLFDGLDEVADPLKRGRAAEAIATFVRHYRGNRFVISSRPRGYEGEARQRLSALCTDCAIRDFDDEDMQAFATNWYTAVTRERLGDNPNTQVEAQRQAEDLLHAIRADERVKSLAHNPLLLSVLAMVHQRGVGLPQRRAELYDECTDMLLGYWDQVKGGEAARELASYGELDRSEKRTLLEPIALWFHERGEQGVEAEKEELEQEIARHFQDIFGDEHARARRRAASFLKVIDARAGLLVERETGMYAFAHLTFQEYLAARAIADREDYTEYTLKHLHDPWWREVILLEVGHLSDVRHFGRRAQRFTTSLIKAIRDANSPLEDILKRDLLFAARALADVGSLGIDEQLRHRLLDEILTLWRSTTYKLQQKEIAEFVSYAGSTSNGTYIRKKLLDLLISTDPCERFWGVQALGQLTRQGVTDSIITSLVSALADHNAKVRQAAVIALGQLCQEEAGGAVFSGLISSVSDQDEKVRRASTIALGQLGKQAVSEAVLAALLSALADRYAIVREGAAAALGQLGERAASESVLSRILLYLADENYSIRWGAGEALARLGKHAASEPVILALTTCLTDPNTYVRQATVKALRQLGERAASESVISAIVTCLTDPNIEVSWGAARTFGELGKHKVSEGILSRVTHYLKDPEVHVRRAALWALGHLGERAASQSVVSAVLACLKDQETAVSLTAAEALGQLSKPTVSETILSTATRYVTDHDYNVRWAAVETLGRLDEQIASEQLFPLLISTLKDPVATVRQSSAKALGRLGKRTAPESVLSALVSALKDQDAHVRWVVTEALREIGDRAVTKPVILALLARLKDEDEDVCWGAAWALGQLGKQAPVPILEQLAEYWRSQLQDNSERSFNGRTEKVQDFAYEELRRIAGHPAFAQKEYL